MLISLHEYVKVVDPSSSSPIEATIQVKAICPINYNNWIQTTKHPGTVQKFEGCPVHSDKRHSILGKSVRNSKEGVIFVNLNAEPKEEDCTCKIK